MNFLLIKSLSTIVNMNHIISAEFTPENMLAEVYDPYSGKTIPERKKEAYLVIVTSEVKAEAIDSHFGSILGAASASGVVRVSGDEAVELWEAIKRIAMTSKDF